MTFWTNAHLYPVARVRMALIAALSAIFSAALSIAPATAQDKTGETVTLPAFAGHSVSLTMPEGWTLDVRLDQDRRYDEAQGFLDPLNKILLAVRRADHVHKREYDSIDIQIYPMNVSIQEPDSARGTSVSASSLDFLIDPERAPWGENTKFDLKADFKAEMPMIQKTALFDDGTVRGERCAVHQPAERVLVRTCFNAGSPDRNPFDVVAPLFDALLNSIEVASVDDAQTPPYRFYRVPQTIVTGGESFL
ncbi:MAG: hypothetical protein AAF683_06580, partial [Pseudomonadota bacterium]